MSPSLTVEDVLTEVEFEIAQGIVSQKELSQAIDAVRGFQNKGRIETFKSLKTTDGYRETFARLFQLNDMLLSLIQEMALTLQAMQDEVKKLRKIPQITSRPAKFSLTEPESAISLSAEDREDFNPISDTSYQNELKQVMKPEAIHVDLQTSLSLIPIIGGLFNRLHVLYHRPAFFYTRMFANRQQVVNETFGEHILFLESLMLVQQRKIEALETKLAGSDKRQDSQGE